MMWKRFIVSVACLMVAMASFACGYVTVAGADYTYMFKTYDEVIDSWWVDASREANIDFWCKYTNGRVGKQDVEIALYDLDVEGVKDKTNAFFKYLHDTKDKEALLYWELNKTLLAKMGDSWYYPKPAEKDEFMRTVERVEKFGAECQSQVLKDRVMYLYMRVMFYLRDYKTCKSVWENNARQWLDDDMKKRCLMYYAGALFYSDETTKAADIYADNEDWESLRYFKCNAEFMKKLYSSNPNSKAFLFFVQNYLNKFQDKKGLEDSKDFSKLCEKIVSENKTDNPALWQSALAHMTFLSGDLEEAIEMIEKAVEMKGDSVVSGNARMLRLLYHAADTTAKDYADKLYMDLPWMLEKVYNAEDLWANNGQGFEHSLNMLSRTIFKYAFPHYVDAGNHNMAAALLNVYDEVFCYDKDERNKKRKDPNDLGSWEYSTYYFNYLDTTSIENVKDFLEFVKAGGNTKLEKALVQKGYVSESMINELIGTKYMRVHNYSSAIEYLEKVRPFFWNKQNITEFLERNPFMENWVYAKDEKGCAYNQYDPAKQYSSNPGKLQFCRIMRDLEQKLKSSSDKEENAISSYAYAVGIEQSENWCWALTQYARSDSWFEGLYSTFRNLESLQQEDNGWDYKTSRSYMLQKRYNMIYSHLANAESQTGSNELLARCQYMRAAIELDRSFAGQYYRSLSNRYAGTRFVGNERRHCDLLSDYR